MQRALIAIGLILVVAGAVYFFPGSPTQPAVGLSAPGGADSSRSDSSGSGLGRTEPPTKRSAGLEGPQTAEPAEEAPIPPEERAKPVYTPDPDDDRALVGLDFTDATDAERERLKVPDRFGKGVIITKIHPDAPAAEAGLAVEDVIVRAHRTAIGSSEDFIGAVGTREHTVLTVSRGGQLFHVVLHKPYIPPAPAN